MKRKLRKHWRNNSPQMKLLKMVGVVGFALFIIAVSGCASSRKESSPSSGDAWLIYTYDMTSGELKCWFAQDENHERVSCYPTGWMMSDQEMRRLNDDI